MAKRFTVLVRVIEVTDDEPETADQYKRTIKPGVKGKDVEVVNLTVRDTSLAGAVRKAVDHLQLENGQ